MQLVSFRTNRDSHVELTPTLICIPALIFCMLHVSGLKAVRCVWGWDELKMGWNIGIDPGHVTQRYVLVDILFVRCYSLFNLDLSVGCYLSKVLF